MLSRVIASLTRRDAPPPETPGDAARAQRAEIAALLQESTLQFVPATEKEHSLGSQREVRDRIADVLPGVTFDDEGHGAFARTGYSVYFDTGSEERVHAVRVQLIGGAAALPPLRRLAAKTGWRLTHA